MNSSPYLQAIQDVKGSTPGEKYKTLNHFARQIIAVSNGRSGFIGVRSSPELPEILLPLVKLEIARITRQPDGIVEALKSDDNLVFNRALRVKWFFDGSIEIVTNVDYFRDRIFGWISVKNRQQIINALSIHLTANNKYSIADEFYSTLTNTYGTKQLEPLLCACSESFIWDAIITRQLVLSARIVERLYREYPDIIVKYLKLSKPNDEPYHRSMHKIPINYYVHFLPRLLKNHVDLFVDLIEWHNNLQFKLSRKSTNRFLKTRINTLINNPSIFVRIMDLKSISSKLTEEQFKIFFHNSFPTTTTEKYFGFSFTEMHDEYLKYYPSNKKVPLILSTFEEVYKKSFLECDDLLEPEVLLLLSPEDRVNAARKKIEKDSQWPLHNSTMEYSWRCYLPISESIPLLKERISKISIAEQRRELLKQMIYSCKVNDDMDALSKVLEYIATRHKNERGDILLKVIAQLMDYIQVQNLSHQHWDQLDDIIHTLNMKDQLSSCEYITRNLFEAKIHFNLINRLPITEPIKFLGNLMEDDYHRNWNILVEHPEYERQCLVEFINVAPLLYSNRYPMEDFLDSFLSSINDFNERIIKVKSSVKPMTIENDWLLTRIPELVNCDSAENLRLSLKKCDPVLYKAWVINNKNDRMLNLKSTKECNEWRKNPDKIAKHWEKYLQECLNEVDRKYGRRFIKICRWHQNLPIKIAEACVKDVIENSNPNALIVLALLFEGSAFESFVDQFLQIRSIGNVETEHAKQHYKILRSIPKALLIVNPPASLNVTSQLCRSDTIHATANWLKELGRETSVHKFIPFATQFMNQSVSISKHFIRSFSTAANIEECQNLYINLWRNQKHQTIRTLVFDKIFDLFVNNPRHETWLLIAESIDDLTVNDKDPLNSMCRIEKIPNRYIVDYVKKLFTTLRRLKDIADNPDSEIIQSHIARLLRLPSNIAIQFPEEMHHDILKTYFTNLSLCPNVSSAAQYYLINAYINPALDKLESRLNFYSDMFVDILKSQWDVPDPHRPDVYPANGMVDSAMIAVLYHVDSDRTRMKFVDVTLKALSSVLTPLQAPMIYSYYVFASLYRQRNMTRKAYANKIGEILPSLIETFSVGFIGVLGGILSECLKLLWRDSHTQHEVTPDIIENLLELDNDQTTMLAISILLRDDRGRDHERYKKILQIFRQLKNPAAIASAAMLTNHYDGAGIFRTMFNHFSSPSCFVQ